MLFIVILNKMLKNVGGAIASIMGRNIELSITYLRGWDFKGKTNYDSRVNITKGF